MEHATLYNTIAMCRSMKTCSDCPICKMGIPCIFTEWEYFMNAKNSAPDLRTINDIVCSWSKVPDEEDI